MKVCENENKDEMSIFNIDDLKCFFVRPGINKAGICKEIGITTQYLNRVLSNYQNLSPKMERKILNVVKKYGYELPNVIS